MSQIFTVTELTARIKQVLEQGFSRVEVTGEISRLTQPSSGHLYFTIKDSHAAISAVVWRTAAARLKTRPKEGQAYVFTGHLSLYEPRGSYQLVVTDITPVGAGRLAEEFERRKTLFAERGWFDASHKKDIPAFPKHIGIVTSQTAAAFEDVKKVLHTRPAWLNITLSPAIVQGESAPQSIAQAMQRLHHLADKPDVILLVRGGGSMEDLWCFNDERVVQAVVDADIPIISGIGHEIDTTLADLAADIRAATPSNAAELVCPGTETLRPQVQRAQHRLRQAINSYKDGKHWTLERYTNQLHNYYRQGLQQKRYQIRQLHTRLHQHEPNQALRNQTQQFYNLKQRLFAAAQRIPPQLRQHLAEQQHLLRLAYQNTEQTHRQQWQKRHEQLLAMNPKHVLKRGYAITTDKQGHIITAAKKLQAGENISLHFHDGVVTSTINKVIRTT
ncbi:exodeoxyribonuclease VII large subunit [Ghiorsea bivora]|uniref:exodeoxyribonuclease VII large subunit n=1 Tax=Ghiorsea bivora TaxID=1485545 RepID=UPI00068A05D5|nr:exodeoxyribonuclease VII large subunit [Ghiorsea bivora]